MYLSYSGFDTHESCNRMYYYGYIAKLRPSKPENRVHMLYGDAVGKLFERFYKDRLWKSHDPAGQMLSLVKPTLQGIITNEVRKGGVFDWEEKGLKVGTRSILEVEGEVIATIPRGIRSIKKHWLLGADVGTEVKLDVLLNGHKVGGRADFIMRRAKPKGDLVIVDGKGSRHREKYANHRQLRWYSMQYYLNYGTLPDRVGFLFWRSEPDSSMDWSTVSVADIEGLKTSFVAAAESLEARICEIEKGDNPLKLFPAQPSDECRLCSYVQECPEGKRSLEKATKDERIADLERGVEDGGFSL